MRLALVVVLALAAVARPAPAQETPKPLLEIGGLVIGGWFADYPASSQNHVKLLPVPYVIYRGDLLRADEGGVRGRFYRGPRAELDLSLGGSLPTSSDDNRARDGMKDLDLMGEIGPRLRLRLGGVPRQSRLDLELGLRAVFTTDLAEVVYRGLVFAPELSWRHAGFLRPGSRLRFGIGPIVATDRYMDYFYDVEPRFARSGRPDHEADAGYLGTRLQGSFRMPLTERLSMFVGGRLEGFWGATNDDSPLFKDDVNASVVTGLSFSFFRSSARVAARDDGLD